MFDHPQRPVAAKRAIVKGEASNIPWIDRQIGQNFTHGFDCRLGKIDADTVVAIVHQRRHLLPLTAAPFQNAPVSRFQIALGNIGNKGVARLT